MSNSLWPHGLQHARLLCPSPSPRVCSNSCPLSRWCHSTILSSVDHFSSCLWSFPNSRATTKEADVINERSGTRFSKPYHHSDKHPTFPRWAYQISHRLFSFSKPFNTHTCTHIASSLKRARRKATFFAHWCTYLPLLYIYQLKSSMAETRLNIKLLKLSVNILLIFYWHKNIYLPHEGNYYILSVLKYLLVLLIHAKSSTHSHWKKLTSRILKIFKGKYYTKTTYEASCAVPHLITTALWRCYHHPLSQMNKLRLNEINLSKSHR